MIDSDTGTKTHIDNENSSSTGLEIAVIGMAGRFPGAKDIDEFWENLKNGVESVAFFTDRELEEAGNDPAEIRDPSYVKAKGALEEAECFDHTFFGYTPAEAKILDPQLRLFHECTWHALEDAGYNPGAYVGKIGLYAGASTNFYWQALSILSGASDVLDPFSASQLLDKDYLTTRISFKLDLRGPSFSVQTACSTSLVAIHLACQGLLSGECAIALAGGVTINAPPKRGYMYREGMVKSRDGHCRAFDARAKGFVGGDGAGIVVLKLLEDALADGDNIHAVIKGSAINNDGGQKAGFTAPSIKSQAGVIKAALDMAEVEPGTVGYIETHGTGTSLGDPIEIEALIRAFDTGKKQFCKIGSLKANMGHLDSAAGVAGFIKTVMVLKHRQIPPFINFETANPKINFADSPFYIDPRLSCWENDGAPLRAGVSSFGIGGTNAHAVLQEAPVMQSPAEGRLWKLLLLSAGTQPGLDRLTENMLQYLEKNPGVNLADAAYTLQTGRKSFSRRRMILCATTAEAAEALSGSDAPPVYRVSEDKNRVVFMFAGLGGQYVNMGLDLYKEEPLFREEMDCCFEIAAPLLGYDLKGILYPAPADDASGPTCVGKRLAASRAHHVGRELDIPETIVPVEARRAVPGIDSIVTAQAVVFILEYALTKLLMAWGVKPHAMIGYSFGEYTAACLGGVFSLEDALRIICFRGKLLDKVPGGAMLSVPLGREELSPLLPAELSIAIDNGSSCIAAGPEAAIVSFEKEMKKKRLMCMVVPHSLAMHSQMMDPVLAEFEAELAKVKLNPPTIPYISNLTGNWISAAEVVKPGYWSKHLRETVCFAGGLAELAKNPGTLFVEIGPGRDLSTMVKRFVDEEKGQRVLNLIRPPQKKVSDVYYLLNMTGYLWLYGVEIDWPAFYREEKRRRLALPTYPFERHYHWINRSLPALIRERGSGETAAADREAVPGVLPVEAETEAAPSLFKRSGLSSSYTAPENEYEKMLVEIWQQFFGTAPLGTGDDFFELGGDSLKAMNVSAMIFGKSGIEIPVAEFFERQNIAGLAAYMSDNTGRKEDFSVGAVEEKEYYPVSSAQRRLYVLQQMGEKNTGYNEPVIVVLKGDLSKDKVKTTFKKLIGRHESLRTSFGIVRGEPVQRIHREDAFDFAIEYFNVNEPPAADSPPADQNKIVNNFIRYFDLDKVPLFRVGLIQTGNNHFLLIVDMHHIISDGSSQAILIEDFMALYKEQHLHRLHTRYRDFSHWQNDLLKTGKMKKQEEYWLREFADEVPEIDLPTDYPRPLFLSFTGSRIDDEVGGEEIAALKELAAGEDVSLYMVFLAIFNIFLCKLSGREDIVFGSLIAGRRHVEFQNIIGMFVNTLALRHYVNAEKTFVEFLEDVRRKSLEIYENQDYQFDSLVDKVVKKRDTGRNPLFDVMFIFQNYDMPGLVIPGLELEPYERESDVSKFDLRLDCVERPDGMTLRFEYSTSLFKEETIRRFTGYFKNIIAIIIENPNLKIGDIEVITAEEKEQLLYIFNDTQTPYPEDKTLMDLFAGQAAKAPDNIAIIRAAAAETAESPPSSEVGELTYAELDEEAGRLAVSLQERGVGADSIAGIMMHRSVEAVTAILAILKTGGAFLPIDPDYPAERIRFMLADSRAKIVLTQRSLENDVEKLGNMQVEKIFVEEGRGEPCVPPSGKAVAGDVYPGPGNLAYIIYTSGSTGKPKGVAVEHCNIVNYICWAIRMYVGKDRVNFPLFTSLSFDLTVTSIFTPLLSGNAVVVYEGESKELLIEKVIADKRVGVVKLTPSHLKIVSEGQLFESSVKRFIVGGEALETQLTKKIVDRFKGGIDIYNEYGPTEAAVGCMIYKFCPETDTRRSVPIGGPAANTKLYILDNSKKTVPVGVPGELYISGAGVARGYLNRPELTAERFAAGGKLYKTGDLCRFIAHDNIEFLGRIDQQVKIRGFRIELGEIECKLKEYRNKRPLVISAEDFKERDDKSANRCVCCLLPDNYPGIHFDDDGVCSVCREYEQYKDEVDTYFKSSDDFEELVREIGKEKQGEYDCLLLFSGGKDSTFVLYRLIDMGLKVLTFTFDNGYISDAAFANIKRTTSALNVENIVYSTENMNRVFIESLNSTNDVCHGCWNALNTFGAKVAHEKGINLVLSGLSRGQIFEMRLEGLFQQGIFAEEEIEQNLQLFRKSFHSKSNKFLRLLDVELTEEVLEQVHFVDFFRYFDMPVAEIRDYLAQKGWVQPVDTGFCSSNCVINDVGIYVHLKETGYHFYAAQLSWDCRLGVIPRQTGIKEIAFSGNWQEVERVLKEIGYYAPPVRDAVVMERESKGGDKIITAYLVSDEELLVPALREYLSGKLPEYMIPADFVQVEKIPLTANGKVDKNALLSLGKKLDSGVEYVAPGSDRERIIAGIWKEVLHLDEVGIHDNFFDLGGTSFDIIRVNSRLREVFEIDIPIVAMYRYTTIASFSQYGEEDDAAAASGYRKEERAGKIRQGKADKQKRRERRTRRIR